MAGLCWIDSVFNGNRTCLCAQISFGQERILLPRQQGRRVLAAGFLGTELTGCLVLLRSACLPENLSQEAVEASRSKWLGGCEIASISNLLPKQVTGCEQASISTSNLPRRDACVRLRDGSVLAPFCACGVRNRSRMQEEGLLFEAEA